jgi:8-oxo-dGTP pyrophosphatase MutT (NUDIX family)
MVGDNLRKIALAIVKNGDSEVLIVKRKNPDYIENVGTLTWAFPGGIVAIHDTPEEVAEQETLEETGHYVKVIAAISNRKYPKNAVHLHYYECELTTDATTQLIDDHEIEQIAWVKVHKLRDHFDTDVDKDVLKHLGIR